MGADVFIDYIISVSGMIDAALHRYLGGAAKDSSRYRYLYGILDEFIARGGKRTRPAMAMLACEAVGGEPTLALSSGCAIEFFHAAALIHDDIMDASLLRRGEPCAHIVHGEPLAINAGDYALGLVCTIVVRDPLLDDATKLAVLDVIGEMSQRTVEGQALDVGWVSDDLYDLTPDDYLDMALGKTGYYDRGRGYARADAGARGFWQECRYCFSDPGRSAQHLGRRVDHGQGLPHRRSREQADAHGDPLLGEHRAGRPGSACSDPPQGA
jgi:geranylgeranyl pyrophosphate synthase